VEASALKEQQDQVDSSLRWNEGSNPLLRRRSEALLSRTDAKKELDSSLRRNDERREELDSLLRGNDELKKILDEQLLC
jgi:hypothetical protein